MAAASALSAFSTSRDCSKRRLWGKPRGWREDILAAPTLLRLRVCGILPLSDQRAASPSWQALAPGRLWKYGGSYNPEIPQLPDEPQGERRLLVLTQVSSNLVLIILFLIAHFVNYKAKRCFLIIGDPIFRASCQHIYGLRMACEWVQAGQRD